MALSADALLKMHDADLAISLNGGFGQQKRHDVLTGLRAALEKVVRIEKQAETQAVIEKIRLDSSH